MNRILDSNTAWMVSGRESVFKTPIARTRQFNPNREQFPETDAPIVTDVDLYTGYDEPTTAQIPGITFPFTLTVNRAKPDFIAFAFAMAMGKVTSAVAYTGATKAKRHQMSRQEGAQLPSCTFERRQGSKLAEIYAGAVCNRVALRYEGQRERFFSLETEWLASSYMKTNSPTAPLGEASGEKAVEYLRGNAFMGSYANDTPGTDLDLSTDTTLTDFSTPAAKGGSVHPLVRALAFEYNNNIDRNSVFATGEGLFPYIINRGQVTETLSATFVKNSAYDNIKAVTDLQDLSLELMVQGKKIETAEDNVAYQGVRLLYPRVNMSNPRDSAANNELRVTNDLAVRRKSATVEAAYVQVYNEVMSYS